MRCSSAAVPAGPGPRWFNPALWHRGPQTDPPPFAPWRVAVARAWFEPGLATLAELGFPDVSRGLRVLLGCGGDGELAAALIGSEDELPSTANRLRRRRPRRRRQGRGMEGPGSQRSPGPKLPAMPWRAWASRQRLRWWVGSGTRPTPPRGLRCRWRCTAGKLQR